MKGTFVLVVDLLALRKALFALFLALPVIAPSLHSRSRSLPIRASLFDASSSSSESTYTPPALQCSTGHAQPSSYSYPATTPSDTTPPRTAVSTTRSQEPPRL